MGAQTSKLEEERNTFFSYQKSVGKKSAIVWSLLHFKILCPKYVQSLSLSLVVLELFPWKSQVPIFLLFSWVLNLQDVGNSFFCSFGVGENVGPNREECLSCHCPPFPTVAARQPGLSTLPDSPPITRPHTFQEIHPFFPFSVLLLSLGLYYPLLGLLQ